jgi:hypothetical protein
LPSNFPYGMTSNLGNLHDRFSLMFLEACYMSDDLTLAKKVAASLKKDLDQQMRYYKSLGDNMTDEQLAITAEMTLQNKGGNLSDKQGPFTQDIVSTYQFLMQMAEMERKFTKPAAGALPGKDSLLGLPAK